MVMGKISYLSVILIAILAGMITVMLVSVYIFIPSYYDFDFLETDAVWPANPADPPAETAIRGKITRIIDGDTLEIDGVRIRLALVDTPERGYAGYSEATEFAREECPAGSPAIYDVDDGQKSASYGRTIAKVWCFGDSDTASAESLNSKLVASNHAVILSHFCNASEYGNEKWASAGCRE